MAGKLEFKGELMCSLSCSGAAGGMVMSPRRAATTTTGWAQLGAKRATYGDEAGSSGAEEQESDTTTSLVLQRQHCSTPHCSSSTAEIHTLTVKELTLI